MSKKRNNIEKNETYWLLPICLILLLVPLIVRMKLVELKGIEFLTWNGQKYNADFFSYYKMIIFTLLAFISMFLFVIKHKLEYFLNFKKSKLYIPLGAYGLLVLLSSVLSQYKKVSFFGYVDRYEGALVILCYIAVFFVTFNMIDDEKDLKKVIKYLFIGSGIVGLIGLLQFVGIDPLKSGIAKSFIVPGQYQNADINFRLGDNIVYSTLYHYNYVGSYSAMLMPLFMAILIFAKDKKMRIISGILSAMMTVLWIGSTSRAGYIGGTVAILFLMIISKNKIFRNKKITLILGIGLIVGFVGANAIMGGYITERFKSLGRDVGIIKDDTAQQEAKAPINYIKVEKDNIKFDSYGIDYSIKKVNGELEITGNNEKLNLKNTDPTKHLWTIENPGYEQVQITIGKIKEGDQRDALLFKNNIVQLNFDITKENSIKILDNRFMEFMPQKAKSIGFEGKERMGSARGYIWSRTLPMLKETLILGKGPDTYCIYFPQNDILGKLKAYDTLWMLVDKPHNIYLQIGFGTGIISLIAFLAFVGGVIGILFKRYISFSPESDTQAIAVGCMLGVIGYMFAGIFNDSVITVAPVFWILIGVGMAAYYLDAKKVIKI